MKFKKTAAVLLAAVMALGTAILPQKTGLTAVAEAAEPEEEQLELKIVNKITTELDIDIDDKVKISCYNAADGRVGSPIESGTVYAGSDIYVQVRIDNPLVDYNTGDAYFYDADITINDTVYHSQSDDYVSYNSYSAYIEDIKADTDNEKTFTVAISGELVKIDYDYPILAGNTTVDKLVAKEGEKVKVTASSDAHNLVRISVYKELVDRTTGMITRFPFFEQDFADDDGNYTIKSGSLEFEMPPAQLYIEADFDDYDNGYKINIEETQNGTVSTIPKKAPAGHEVTLKIIPDEGYELGSIKVWHYIVDKTTGVVAEKEITVTDGKFMMPYYFGMSEELSGIPEVPEEFRMVTVTATFKKSANQPETGDPTDQPETDNSTPTIPPSTSTAGSTGTSEPTTSETETSTPYTTEPTVFEPVIDSTDLDEAVKEVVGGITVTDSNGAFEDGVVMNISDVESTDGLFSFDITFTKDGKEVQPNGKVTVKVPVPETMKNGNIYIYHYDENGNRTLVPSKVENGFVIFEADRFSVYALSNVLLDEANSDTSSDESSETSTPDSDSTSKPVSNPSTGIGLALVPVFIAAGAVIASAKKRK